MNSAATQLLKELGLPRTETLSIQEIAVLPATERVYLRYRTGSGFRNSRVQVSQLLADLAVYESRVEAGELVTCERCYQTIVGGITVLKKGFVYSELVEGHSIALLRRGCCGTRLLQDHGGRSRVIPVVQRWSAEQGDEYTYRPAGEPGREVLQECGDKLRFLAGLSDGNVLLEWMWTPSGLLFCDASALADASFGDSIPEMFVPGSVCVVVRLGEVHATHPGRRTVHCDTLDCDQFAPAEDGDTIFCMHGPLLSHFVTRALARRVGVTWLDPKAMLPVESLRPAGL